MASVPAWPSSESLPLPPTSESLPPPAVSVSLPSPPVSTLTPPLPMIRLDSVLPVPSMGSLPASVSCSMWVLSVRVTDEMTVSISVTRVLVSVVTSPAESTM